ncbi:hypothetical protein LX36DRAFT_655299 [Colletotrichum falcatum]|nr:hypothetical protein LX36DRAFT_655299 [Colletotrichum falcatum]
MSPLSSPHFPPPPPPPSPLATETSYGHVQRNSGDGQRPDRGESGGRHTSVNRPAEPGLRLGIAPGRRRYQFPVAFLAPGKARPVRSLAPRRERLP